MREKGFDLDLGELGSKTEYIEIQRLKDRTVGEVQRLEYARKIIKEDVQGQKGAYLTEEVSNPNL